MRRLVSLFLPQFVAACALSANELTPAQAGGISCNENYKYVVVSRQLRSAVGADILVKYKSVSAAPAQCQFLIASGDFELPTDWGEDFLSLEGDLLILEGGTGPDLRGLTIWDLRSRKKVYHDLYFEPIEIGPEQIEYWRETGSATEQNCPKKRAWEDGGLGAVIVSKVTLSLPDLKLSISGESRCAPRQ